jgi:hypothetical protein
MRRPGGYSIIVNPEGPPQEADTFTCRHCQRIVFVKPMCDPADMGGRCTCCNGLICPNCVGLGCDPVEKKLQRLEARRSYEGNSWL